MKNEKITPEVNRHVAAVRRLYRQWSEEIAEACEEEGYPPYGANYELRMMGVYEDAFEYVCDALIKGENLDDIAAGYSEKPVNAI